MGRQHPAALVRNREPPLTRDQRQADLDATHFTTTNCVMQEVSAMEEVNQGSFHRTPEITTVQEIFWGGVKRRRS
jgi:hypothetical protein